jgi:CRP-like cAMP-binding protein
VASIGRREAYPRIAHLFCELFVRFRAIGLNNGDSYPMPITQSELADATGLSTVHVNRTMQELRADGLIKTTKKGVVTILDWEALQKAAEFDPTYLHLQKRGA